MENIDLKHQLNDKKINLEGIQNSFAEQQVKAGKVPLLESDNEDLKMKLKRYENTEKDIMKELNNVTNQRNDLLKKIDDYSKNPHLAANASNKRNTGRSTTFQRSGINANTSDLSMNKPMMMGGGKIFIK